jgi:hypothetical protein
MICNNIFPNPADRILQKLFFWVVIYALVSSLAITLVTSLTNVRDVQLLFPLSVEIVFFLVTGAAYVYACRKDKRKAVSETKAWKVSLVRIFVVLALLFYMMSFMTYILDPFKVREQSKTVITILSLNVRFSDISNWGQLTALCKFVSLLIDKEMDEGKRRPFKIALLCFLLIGFSCLTVIALKLEYGWWIGTLRLVEVAFLLLCNLVFSVISGIEREVFSPESGECVVV